MVEKIIEKAKGLNIEKIGFTKQGQESFIICLFPYYTEEFPDANLSKYTVSEDYHIIIKKYLDELILYIKELFPNSNSISYVDIDPYDERQLAKRAGLGFIGRNGLLINDDFGSFVFIGVIKTDLDLPSSHENNSTCMQCNNCIKACPSNALEDSFDKENCLSHITQIKGELSNSQIQKLKKSNLIFGCDICQNVCPHNKNIKKTPILNFYQNIITNLTLDEIEDLSNKEFKEKFGDRSFSWRGKNVLIRNLRIIFKNFRIL